MTSFAAERRAFTRLKTHCPPESRREYERAIRTLLERYNTTIHENRFVVGGAVEVFTCALLRSVGLDCNLYSAQEQAGDILLPKGKKLSIKGSFKGGAQDIKLINQMGGGRRDWNTATLFVLSGEGIVYGAPDMVAAEHIKQVGDGVVLKRAGLQMLMSQPKNLFAMNIALKPPTETTAFSEKASVAVAKQILLEAEEQLLWKAFSAEG